MPDILNLIGVIVLFIVVIVAIAIFYIGLPMLVAYMLISKDSEDGYGSEEIDIDTLTAKMLEFERDMNRIEMQSLWPMV